MAKFRLSKQQVSQLNKDLSDLEHIKEDIKLAEKAGVPNMDELLQVCDTCTDRIVKLKQYFASKEK